MLNNSMNVLDVQWEHGKTKLLIKGAELTSVNKTGTKSKLELTYFSL